jgi:hypothetical protein
MDVSNQLYAEPVVQLAYVNTEVRNGAVLGTVFAGDATSGMIFKPELSVKLWNEFNGSNTATFSGLTVTDNTPDLFGEVGLGLEAINFSNGWSGTLKGDVQFANEFSSLGGFVGLRKEF